MYVCVGACVLTCIVCMSVAMCVSEYKEKQKLHYVHVHTCMCT